MNLVEEKFFKEEAEPILMKYSNEVIKNLIENEDRFKKQIFEVLMNIADRANQKEEYRISYINFSLLKISMLNEKYEIIATAYDENWYADEGIEEIFTIDYIFKNLYNIKTDIYNKSKKYVGKIRRSSINYYILRQMTVYNEYLTYFFIKFLKQWDEDTSYKEMPKNENIKILYGEYKDYSETVYYYEEKVKDQKEFEDKGKGSENKELVFSCWPSLKLNNIVIKEKDLTCIYLKDAELENVMFDNCTIVGANFKFAKLKKCYFKNCDLGTSDLSESTLEEVFFEDCNLRNLICEGIKSHEVYIKDEKYTKEKIEV